MDDNFYRCNNCGEQRPVNTPSCPTCVTRKALDEGHYGWYDLTRGWTCFSGCPVCHPEEEMIDLTDGIYEFDS